MQSCEFNIYDGDEKVRFSLGQDGRRKLFIIGLNPSTADAEKSDQTTSKVKGFIKRQRKFDGFVMLNLCALRSTNPNDLSKPDCKYLPRLIERNSNAIRRILRSEAEITVWAAWGNNITKRQYLFDCLRAIVAMTKSHTSKIMWVTCGKLTKQGHPRHPSRLGYEVGFEPFFVESYLQIYSP